MNLHHFFKTFVQTVSADTVLEHTNKIWNLNKWADFNKYNDVVEYLLQFFHDYGWHCECIDLPADGETGFGDAILPFAWNCEEGKVELTAPNQKVLADRANQPNCIGMWSPSTPDEGIEAEVVVIKSDDPAQWQKVDAKGKWIVTPLRFQSIRQSAIKAEVAGVISGWTSNPDAKEEIQWINSNSDTPAGWGTRKSDKPIIAISLSPQTVDELMSMAHDQSVSLKVTIKSENASGVLPFVHAHLPGEPGEQEILLIAPIFGQGANYNAVGTASILEMARIFQSAIDQNALPRPKRTIRLLLVPKVYGTLAFAHDQNGREALQKTLFALCFETGAGNADHAWSRWRFHPTPTIQRHFSNGLIWHIAQEYLQAWRPQRHLEKRSMRLLADVFYNDPQVGVPTSWLHGGTDKECKNSSADDMTAIDRRSCIDLPAAAAAIFYTAATVGRQEIPHLAIWNYDFALEAIHQDMQTLIDQAAEADNLDELDEILGQADRILPLRLQHEKRALESLHSLTEEYHDSPEWDCVHELMTALNNAVDTAAAVVKARAEARAIELGEDAGDISPKQHASEDERVPHRIVDVVGTVLIDHLPFDQWTAPLKKSPRYNLPYIVSWWLADGERTIGEIERLLQLDVSDYKETIADWFDFLQRHGYISFEKEAPAETPPMDETQTPPPPIEQTQPSDTTPPAGEPQTQSTSDEPRNETGQPAETQPSVEQTTPETPPAGDDQPQEETRQENMETSAPSDEEKKEE